MHTNDLIRALDADARWRSPPLSAVWWSAAVASTVIAAVALFVLLGPRPDIAQAAQTLRFLFKFVVTMTLVAGAFLLARKLSHPGENIGGAWFWLAVAPALLVAAVALELVTVPSGDWAARLIGTNSRVCLTYIPLIGIVPLVVFIAAFRRGAPTRPALSGAVAGLLAGGIAATFYAAQCTDDSPLFVATWYPIAIGALAALGAAIGKIALRW
jgi:hypothetical protein